MSCVSFNSLERKMERNLINTLVEYIWGRRKEIGSSSVLHLRSSSFHANPPQNLILVFFDHYVSSPKELQIESMIIQWARTNCSLCLKKKCSDVKKLYEGSDIRQNQTLKLARMTRISRYYRDSNRLGNEKANAQESNRAR